MTDTTDTTPCNLNPEAKTGCRFHFKRKIWAYRCPECDGIIQEKVNSNGEKFFVCAKDSNHTYESNATLKKDYLWGLEYQCPKCGAIERLGM